MASRHAGLGCRGIPLTDRPGCRRPNLSVMGLLCRTSSILAKIRSRRAHHGQDIASMPRQKQEWPTKGLQNSVSWRALLANGSSPTLNQIKRQNHLMFLGEGLWGMGRPHVAGRRSSFTELLAAQCACCLLAPHVELQRHHPFLHIVH